EQDLNVTLTNVLDFPLHEDNFLWFKSHFVCNFDELPFHHPINIALPDQCPRGLSVKESYFS
ncbi:hypothetical protein CTAM01_15965, partial [Colletotrichum tamarilloi]